MALTDPLEGEALKEALAAGDAAAFARVFDAYAARLRRFAYRYLGSWTDAEDAVHDVFVQLWLRRGTLQFLGELESYLYTATRNQSLDLLKRRRVRERRAVELAAPAAECVAEPADPESDLAAEELTAALQRAVDGLPPRQREVVLLRWQQASYDEIATTLGISPKTVSIHIGRAFEALRRVLPRLLS